MATHAQTGTVHGITHLFGQCPGERPVGTYRLYLLIIFDDGRPVEVKSLDLWDLNLIVARFGNGLASLLINQVFNHILNIAGLEYATGDAISHCFWIIVAGLTGSCLTLYGMRLYWSGVRF